MRNHIHWSLFLLITAAVWSTGCSDGWSRREEIELSPPQYCRYPAPLLAPEYSRLAADGPENSSETNGENQLQAEGQSATMQAANEGQVFVFEDDELTGTTDGSDGATNAEEQSCVDINRDGPESLTRLPGVGQRRAEQIVAMRNVRPFTRLRHLRRVKGIGRKTVQKLAPLVCPL